jgi:hypothetical protein
MSSPTRAGKKRAGEERKRGSQTFSSPASMWAALVFLRSILLRVRDRSRGETGTGDEEGEEVEEVDEAEEPRWTGLPQVTQNLMVLGSSLPHLVQ